VKRFIRHDVADTVPGVAVPVLGGWHVYLASRGETSIESHDNHYLEGKAKAEGLVSPLIGRWYKIVKGKLIVQIYLNPYDLGRKRNLQLFFNVGPGG
jgi:palmitoyltransferase